MTPTPLGWGPLIQNTALLPGLSHDKLVVDTHGLHFISVAELELKLLVDPACFTCARRSAPLAGTSTFRC